MEAVQIDTLPTTKSLLKTNVPETTDTLKEKDDIFSVDEIDEDDEIRLRLSDDDENEQDSSSGQPENQQTNSHVNRNDLEVNVCLPVASKKISESRNKQALDKPDLSDADTTTSVKKDKVYINNSLNENIVDEMSGSEKVPPIMQSSSKYWSSDFDKKWKLHQSHRSFSHRGPNDWYNQQYPEKEQFNKKHFNNHNYHFNTMTNNVQENYKEVISQPRINSSEESNKGGDTIGSLKLKNNTTNLIDTKETNHLVPDNSVTDDSQCEKINLVQNDNLITENVNLNAIEMNVIETDLNQIENKLIDKQLYSNKECKENLLTSNEDILKTNEINTNEESTHSKKDINHSKWENCDVVITELEEKSELKTEEASKTKENDCSIVEAEEKNSITNHLSNNTEEISEDVVNSEVCNEIQTKVTEILSHNDDILEDKPQNGMEVDSINVSTNIDDKSSNGDSVNNNATSASDYAKENDADIKKDSDKVVSQEIENGITCIDEMEQKLDEINENIDKKLNNIVSLHENSNESVEHKTSAVNEMQVSKIDESNVNKCSPDTNRMTNEVMDVDSDTESCNSLSIANNDDKDSDKELKDSDDKDEKSSLKTILLLNNENSCEIEDRGLTEVNEDKKLEDVKITEREINENEKISNIIEEVDLVDDESEIETISNTNKTEVNSSVMNADDVNCTSAVIEDTIQSVPISPIEDNKMEESNEDGRAVVHKRRRRKRLSQIMQEENGSSDLLGDNGVRQKRRSAKNAEEMIRKEILKDDEDDDEDSSYEPEKLVPINYKKTTNVIAQPLSPPSLKRTLEDVDSVSDSITLKKIKASTDSPPVQVSELIEKKEIVPESKENIAETNELVRKISTEDIRGKLKSLKQEELEALLLQKVVECITIRGEMGKLREQARVSKRNQEATRAKCQQLQKQVEGFDMVLKRINYDKNSNNDKYLTPIKINRSVGLQVNFVTDHGIHNLKQIQALKAAANANNSASTLKTIAPMPSTNTVQDNRSMTQSPRKMLKTRSPRRSEIPTPAVVQVSTNSSGILSTTSGSIVSTALVMGKAIDPSSKRAITLQSQNNIVQIVPPGQQQTVINSNVSTVRPGTMTVQRQTNSTIKASDLIDLTDEEDKSKSASVIAPITTGITTRYSRVLQAVPASVALSNSSNLRLVQAGSQGAPTTIVNNMNRLAYVMQSGVSGVPTKQLVLTNSNTIRPVTNISARNISTINYKQGVTTLTNGTVRLLTTQAPTTNVQMTRHPAPLPETPLPESNPSWKLPPPAPTLKISKVATGIVLSWTMTLSDKFAEIVSYQLYAYQEITGMSPSATLWKKVGDVRALPLPMACTLTQFTEGNNYYFAVRAVDIHSRFGQYSKPGNISL